MLLLSSLSNRICEHNEVFFRQQAKMMSLVLFRVLGHQSSCKHLHCFHTDYADTCLYADHIVCWNRHWRSSRVHLRFRTGDSLSRCSYTSNAAKKQHKGRFRKLLGFFPREISCHSISTVLIVHSIKCVEPSSSLWLDPRLVSGIFV